MKNLHRIVLGLGAVFLVCLVWRIGLRELWHELFSLGWGLIPLLLSEGAAEMIHTLGWRHCLTQPYRSLSFLLLFRIRMAGYAINYLTPTAAMGGEVTRAALLSAHGRGPEAVTGVLIDKACMAVAHLMFVITGAVVILWRFHLPTSLSIALVLAGILLAIGIIAFLLLQKHGQLGVVMRWLAKRNIGGPRVQQAAVRLTAVDESFKTFYRERPVDVMLSVAWHLVAFPVGILQTWLFFALLNQHASFMVAASAWFLGLWFDLLTFAVPLNLGTLEASRILTFRALGYQSLQGMTYGVMLRLTLLFWAAVGLVNYALLASNSVRRAATQPDDVFFPVSKHSEAPPATPSG